MQTSSLKSSWVRWVQVSFVFLMLGCVLMQLVIPWVAGDTGTMNPEVQHLVVPYSVAGVLAVLFAEVALILAWLVVRAAGRGDLFAEQTSRHVDAMRWLVLPMVGIPVLVAAHLLFVERMGHPGVVLALFAALVVGVVLFTLLSLGRDVYRYLATEHAELEAVI